MRDELTMIELADRYLRGELNATDRAAFEERMRTNAELRELVEDQRALLGGIQRLALRPAVHKAYRSYKFGKWAPGIGGAAVIAILAVGGWMLAKHSDFLSEKTNSATERTEQLLALSDTTGTDLPALVMTIDLKADTTMITPNGLVLDIPQGAFMDDSGRAITKPVRVTLLEAIDGVDIMKAGLSTMSGDTLLETGGMFYIDAQVDGKRVGIDPSRPLTVMVPSDKADPRMMLYEGVMNEDGVVDWRNPQPLARTLVPVDITTLDFYPPGYVAKVAELGKDATDKGYTDSLYWSFQCPSQTFNPAGVEMDPLLNDVRSETIRFVGLGAALANEQAPGTDMFITPEREENRHVQRNCGIDPARVQAIWNERFNGTNLATREFEERMREIHRTCDNKVLDLYANNLGTNLGRLDSMAVRMGHGAFASFALRNDGRVELPPHAAERLRRVYREWSVVNAQAARMAWQAYREEQRAFDAQDDAVRKADADAERTAAARLVELETAANLNSVYTQLGYAVPPPGMGTTTTAALATSIARSAPVRAAPPAPPSSAFVAQVRTFGWKNIDRALTAATDRQSVSISDGRQGRQAQLTYDACMITVPGYATYEDVRVYLLPRTVDSYQRMRKGLGERFEDKLNGLFTYDLVVLASKEGGFWYAEQQGLKGNTVMSVTLERSSEEVVEQRLRDRLAGRGGNVRATLSRMTWNARTIQQRARTVERTRLVRELTPVVFPCSSPSVPVRTQPEARPGPDTTTAPAQAWSMEAVQSPEFPGGERAMRLYFMQHQRLPEEFRRSGTIRRVSVRFVVEANGQVSRARTMDEPGDALDREAERLVRDMPLWIPGRREGRPAAVEMIVPVTFLAPMERLN